MKARSVVSLLRDPRYQGWWADLAVFVATLILFQILGVLSREFVLRAETDPTAKLSIGLFFLAILVLQPWGPWLKRHPFHQRHPGIGQGKDSLAGCGVAIVAFFYLIALIIIAGAASTMISEVLLAGNPIAETIAPAAFLIGVAWSIGCAVVLVRFFLPPKKPAGSSRIEVVADLSIYLNLILLQLVWGAVMASAIFWEVVIKTPLGKPNSATAIFGRFLVLAVVAMMVYLPPRIFFLVEQRRRRLGVLSMLVANLPIILKALLATTK